jgi:hypothetical protein
MISHSSWPVVMVTVDGGGAVIVIVPSSGRNRHHGQWKQHMASFPPLFLVLAPYGPLIPKYPTPVSTLLSICPLSPAKSHFSRQKSPLPPNLCPHPQHASSSSSLVCRFRKGASRRNSTNSTHRHDFGFPPRRTMVHQEPPPYS